jgi:hypothetical protein
MRAHGDIEVVLVHEFHALYNVLLIFDVYHKGLMAPRVSPKPRIRVP